MAEIVGLGAEATGHSGDPAAAVSEALRRVDLGGYGGRFFQMLSGGEQQRVHLARVLAQLGAAVREDGPHWLILDEPVSSLDIGHQLMVMRIARLAQDGPALRTAVDEAGGHRRVSETVRSSKSWNQQKR